MRAQAPVLAAVVGVAVVAALSRAPGPPVLIENVPTSLVPNAQLVRTLGKSHLSLLADLYWIRMTSFAARANRPYEARALIAWGQFVTDLDPQFFWAYAMGGVLGPLRFGSDTYNVEEGIALLKKGIEHLPQEFRLYVYLAFTQIDLAKDLKGASETVFAAAKIPNAPAFLAPLATRLLAQTGSHDTARQFALEMAQSVTDPAAKQTFEFRVREIDRDAAVAQLESAVTTFRTRFGRAPLDLQELVTQQVLTELPIDPFGGTFSLDENGSVKTTSGERLRVFQPPGDD